MKKMKIKKIIIRTVGFGFGRHVARVGGRVRLFRSGFLRSAVAPREPRVGGPRRRRRLRLLLLLLLLALFDAAVLDDRVDHRLRQDSLVQRPAHDDRTRRVPVDYYSLNLQIEFEFLSSNDGYHL